MRLIVVACCVAALAGCRNDRLAQADYGILFDGNGCAYYVEPGAGDTSFVRPLPDANKATCK